MPKAKITKEMGKIKQHSGKGLVKKHETFLR